MADFLGATQSLSDIAQTGKSLVSSGLASGLSETLDTVSGAVSALGSFFSGPANKPQKNPLSAYASHSYVLGLSVLPINDLNNPDKTYMAGKVLPLICKSANANPSNRVNTPYGKLDFFMDNLSIESTIGFQDYRNSFTTTVQFDITEPYSALMFPYALSIAAGKAGYENWRDAPFLLTIEFRGNRQDGTLVTVPNTTRYIPIKLSTMQIRTNEKGTVYNVTGFTYNDLAHTKEYSEFKTDISVSGKTVQEVLQTGQNSLQAVVNKRFQELKKRKIVNEADEVIILFPKNISSSKSPTVSTGVENNATATISSIILEDDVYKKIGVAQSTINNNYVQKDGDCNELGKASLGLSATRKGTTPMSMNGFVYDENKKVYVRGNITYDPKEGNFNFAQSQNVKQAINEILLSSSYPETAMNANNVDANGMKKWWTIDTQVFVKTPNANSKKTNTNAKIIVYRVIPYGVQSSVATAASTKAKGLDNIKKKIVKAYDYIYTGKNTEVLKFDIDFSVSFSNILAADNFKDNQDIKRDEDMSNQEQQESDSVPIADGGKNQPGTNPSQVKSIVTKTSTDFKGGGSPDTYITRIGRIFHDAATTKNLDMMMLNMDILGDPFWIPQSGLGNYSSEQNSSAKDITAAGTLSYQQSEVDVYVNFRTPLDVNQGTGMYNFGSSSAIGPVLTFSGIYNVTQVLSTFRGGRFVQTLKGNRRKDQELKAESTPEQTINTSTTAGDKGSGVEYAPFGGDEKPTEYAPFGGDTAPTTEQTTPVNLPTTSLG